MSISPFIWLIAGCVIMALEILIPGFVLFWFGLAALLTSAISFLNVLAQPFHLWICFFSISIITLILWHFYLKNLPFFKKNTQDDYRDVSFSELKGIVIEEIQINKPGKIQLSQPFHGIKEWKAEASENIAINENVSVIDADGIRLVVKKLR